MNAVIQKARDLATERHSHLHLYNAARSPAIIHIAEVAALTEQYGGSVEMIAAAWLHDIVEDTNVTLSDIEKLFGPTITTLVDGLTDPPEFASFPLEKRKMMQAERLQKKSDDVKKIKICDQLSNVLRVLNDPPTDWDEEKRFIYIRGARSVTEVCRSACLDLDNLFDQAYEQACVKHGERT